MFKKFSFSKKLSKKEEIEEVLNDAAAMCDKLFRDELESLNIFDYEYVIKDAVDDLGLDEDLVNQLLEDYVAQIIKSIDQFNEYIELLKDLKMNVSESDFITLRELAHKNLGVARNLRIKDAEKLLYDLLKKDDLEHLSLCLKALEACAIKLKPECAYDTLYLIKIKNSF